MKERRGKVLDPFSNGKQAPKRVKAAPRLMADLAGGHGDAFLQQKTSGSPSAMMCLAQPSVYPDYCGCNSTTTSIGLLLY